MPASGLLTCAVPRSFNRFWTVVFQSFPGRLWLQLCCKDTASACPVASDTSRSTELAQCAAATLNNGMSCSPVFNLVTWWYFAIVVRRNGQCRIGRTMPAPNIPVKREPECKSDMWRASGLLVACDCTPVRLHQVRPCAGSFGTVVRRSAALIYLQV